MGQALRAGGLYYVGEQAVDANGKKIEDAPPRPKDTPANEQPAQLNAGASDPMTRLANAIERLVPGAQGAASQQPQQGGVAVQQDPKAIKVDELDDYLAKVQTVDEVEALAKKDDRTTAAPKYEARINEILAK